MTFERSDGFLHSLEPILNKRYAGLILDTGPLLLYLMGHFDINQIGRSGKVKGYSLEQFLFLNLLVEKHFSGKLLYSTSIITEVCNHSGNYNTEIFFRFIETFLLRESEIAVRGIDLVKENPQAFYKFGMADASILSFAKKNAYVITEDLSFYGFLQSQKHSVLNFNYTKGLK